jgi:hypothetical protein
MNIVKNRRVEFRNYNETDNRNEPIDDEQTIPFPK